MAETVIRIDPKDTVAVAPHSIEAGAMCGTGELQVQARETIPRAHKIALHDIPAGSPVTKYGAPIGHAAKHIPAGSWVHVHNLETNLQGEVEYRFEPTTPAATPARVGAAPEFSGYRRSDGTVGTRNELWILPTTGCMDGMAQRLAAWAAADPRFAHLDAVAALPHQYGCNQIGQDLARTQRLLARLASHPNAAGVLVLSLGCENTTTDVIEELVEPAVRRRLRCVTAQRETDEVAQSRRLLLELADGARGDSRIPLPLSQLRIGLKCGASDAFSGLSANPVVGSAVDILAAAGAGIALTEVPELFGAEEPLLNRSVDDEVFACAADLLNGFKRYYLEHGVPVYENPAPGNREGGITTLEEKSLGCVRKGGTAPLTDARAYAEPLRRAGLAIVQAPGNDLVSTTALVAAGVHVVLFTTGRGNPLGTMVPCIKVSSTSQLAREKPSWIDFDAGPVLGGTAIRTLGKELAETVVRVASGEKTRNEENGYRDIGIWTDGVTV